MKKVEIIRKGKAAKAFDALETFKKLSGVTLPTPPAGDSNKKTKSKKVSKRSIPTTEGEMDESPDDKELDKTQPSK